MIKKLINKLTYKFKFFFRNLLYYFRYYKSNNKDHWTVKEFSTYDQYLEFQKEKTLDKSRRSKWLNEEWEEKVKYFTDIFDKLFKELNFNRSSNCLCIGARTGQEVFALKKMGYSAIGIDIVECKPLVELGDMHNLKYDDQTFNFVFSNILDHSLYPQKSISEIERVLKKDGYCFLQITVGEATDMYGVTEIKSDTGIIKLFKDSEVVFTRNIKQYSIAQNWEILFKKK